MKNYTANQIGLLILCSVSLVIFSSGYSDTGINNVTKKEKTVFLTGAAGFIGSNFLRYMFDKYPNYYFIVLDALTYAGNLENIPDTIKTSPRFEFLYGNIINQELVDSLMKRADLVVHFAAESHVTRSILNDKTFVETDVFGTQVMLHSLVRSPNVERFIYISTSEVYGTAETEPMDENHPLNPKSPYAAVKAGADRLAYSYCCTYDVPVVIIRPFNNYGPNQHLEKMIPKFVTSVIKGKKMTLHGDGSAKRDWVNVLDTCEALDRVLHVENFDAIKHQVINIGTGVSTTNIDIARQVLEYFGLPETYLTFVGDRPGQVQCHIASTDKAFRLLGWRAKRTLRDALPAMIKWYEENEAWWHKAEMMQWVPIYTKQKRVELQ